MIYRLGADLVLIVHLGFVLFVVLGGLARMAMAQAATTFNPSVDNQP